MGTRARRRKLNAKKLYFQALKSFIGRNCDVLPQLQLQHGKCERWLSREFALAMNTHLADSSAAGIPPAYTDCELSYADISVWRPPTKEPLALYEVKALYRQDPIEGVVEKARRQLASSPLAIAENRIGLFFAIFVAMGAKAGWPADKAKTFEKRVRDSVRDGFSSDHRIRMTEMVAPTEILFGTESWWTASWLTWGRPK